DLVEFAAMKSIVEHGREVLGNAGHAAGADRLDAGLLDCLEYGARLLPARHELAMHHGIVAGEPECGRVGTAPDRCRIRAAELAWRLGQPRLAGHDTRTFRGKSNLELGLAGDRAQASRDRALERLGWGIFRWIFGPDVRRHHSVTGILSSAPHCRMITP